jgi:hypothetical protein
MERGNEAGVAVRTQRLGGVERVPGEHRLSSFDDHGSGIGSEAERGRDDLLSLPQSDRDEGYPERIAAVVDPDCVLNSEIRRHLGLKGPYVLAKDEVLSLDNLFRASCI